MAVVFRLFKTIITPNAPSFVVWPAASKPASTASGMLEEILEKNIECVLGVDFVVVRIWLFAKVIVVLY